MSQDPALWEEEREDVKRRASKIALGAKWKLGLYQVVWDDDPPETRIKDNTLSGFLVPEAHFSLKLYFDNLRNYGICAIFAALGAWAWLKLGQNLPPYFPSWFATAVASAAWILVAVLLLLNCLQTWIITSQVWRSIRKYRQAKFYVYRLKVGSAWRIVFIASHMLFLVLFDVVVGFLVLTFSATTIFTSLGFFVYSVLGHQGWL